MKKLKYNSRDVFNYFKYIKYNTPTTVFLKLTSKCMLKCNFCSQGEAQKNEINIYKAKKILKLLKKKGVLRIFYTGGEPFLYSELQELLEYGNKIGLCQLIITNGYLLSNNGIYPCLKYLNGISISIHGDERTHNSIVNNKFSYQMIIKGIELIKKDFPKIVIDFCLTATPQNTNKTNFTAITTISKKYSIPINVTRMYEIGNAQKIRNDFKYINKLVEIVTYYQKKGYDINIGHCLVQCDKKNHLGGNFCDAGIEFCFIDINGDVKICGNSSNIIGNIYKKNFVKIFRNNLYKINKRLKKLPLLCKNCSMINECLGGCKSEIYMENTVLNDNLAITIMNKKWNNIKDKKVHVEIGSIKKINFRQYLIIGRNKSIINKNTLKIIKLINNSKTLNEILESIFNKYDEFEVKNLFILLYNDEFILE